MFIEKSASSKKISESFARAIWGKSRNFKKPFFKALENRCLSIFKGATKMYFTHYSCVVIILFNKSLRRSAFFTISSIKLVFRLSVLSVVFDASQIFSTKTLKYVLSSFKKL